MSKEACPDRRPRQRRPRTPTVTLTTTAYAAEDASPSSIVPAWNCSGARPCLMAGIGIGILGSSVRRRALAAIASERPPDAGCAPHVSWIAGLRRPALQGLLVVSAVAFAAGGLGKGNWLIVAGPTGLFLVAVAVGAIRFTGGELKTGIITVPVEIVTLRRRLAEAVEREQRGLMIVACRLCGDEDVARRLIEEEVAFVAGKRWPHGPGPGFKRYLYCEVLIRAAADEALGTGPEQHAYLAQRYGPRFAELDPVARVRAALERVALPAGMVDDLLDVFTRSLRRGTVTPGAAPGSPHA